MTDEAESPRLQVLRRARALLEAGWTQHLLARDADGKSVAPWSDRATCFCLLGALQRSIVDEAPACEAVSYVTEHSLLQKRLKMHPGTWNDLPFMKKENVLSFMDKYIHDVENQDA